MSVSCSTSAFAHYLDQYSADSCVPIALIRHSYLVG